MSTPGRIAAVALVGIGAALLAAPLYRPELRRAETWQRMASPGKLSHGHAFLENDCASCHTPVKGPEAAKCIACHANEESILARQPTSFHSDIASCRECHAEHQGVGRQPSVMDHEALARIGLRSLKEDPTSKGARDQLVAWIRQPEMSGAPMHGETRISAEEAVLNCSTCHATKDRHRGFFGTDCADCHGTSAWSIAEFRHPSPESTDCAQCHQAPPSHYMEHFRMISQAAARQEHAQPNQCFLCHQTTSWNDIKGVGWYKHH